MVSELPNVKGKKDGETAAKLAEKMLTQQKRPERLGLWGCLCSLEKHSSIQNLNVLSTMYFNEEHYDEFVGLLSYNKTISLVIG